jgi:hypothetical protein
MIVLTSQHLKREKFHLLLYLRSTKASRLESHACMFQELSKNRLTNPSKARRMSNASHLEEAIEHHHSQDRNKKPIKKRPPAGRSSAGTLPDCSLPLDFYSKTKTPSLCPFASKNSSAHSSPMIMPIPSMCSRDKEKEEKTPSLFYVYRPRYANFSSFMRSMPEDFLSCRHHPDSTVGNTRKVNSVERKVKGIFASWSDLKVAAAQHSARPLICTASAASQPEASA